MTAKEAKELTAKGAKERRDRMRTQTDRELQRAECEIRDAAQKGNSYAELRVNEAEVARAMADKLKERGFEVTITWVTPAIVGVNW